MNLKEFNEIMFKIECSRTNFPYPVKTKYRDKKANDLTKCIVDFCNKYMDNCYAERINTMGVYREKWLIDPITNKKLKKNGGVWTKGGGTAGSADISVTYKGKTIKIEVKIGKDRQSEAQKQYELNTIKSGGYYFIAKNFEQFHTDFMKIVNNI